MKEPEQLFREAKESFEQNRHKMAVGDKPAMSREVHAEFAAKADVSFAKVIDEYLPQLLPFCKSKLDVSAAMAGLVYSGEIKDIPEDVLSFMGRGLWFATLLVATTPYRAQKILDSVDSNGYPTEQVRDDFFRSTNRFGEEVTCAGILSGTAAIRILMANQDKVRQIHLNDKMQEDELKYLRV